MNSVLGGGCRRTLAGAGAAAAMLLAGCGAGAGAPGRVVTVTQDSSPTTSPSTTPTPTATSDVKGRAFDLGTVTSFTRIGDVVVVELDRWTLPGTSDSAIARSGITIAPHRGARYTNQNTSKTYSAPLTESARVVVNKCVVSPGGQLGMTSEPLSAVEWLKKPDPKAVLVVAYDESGAITRMDTDPRCPS